MSTVTFEPTTLDLLGETYFAHPATVSGLRIWREDHGILTAFVYLDLQTGGSQGFGGYCLDTYEKHSVSTDAYATDRRGTEYGTDWLIGLLDVLGSLDSAQVKGRNVYALKADKSFTATINGLVSFDGARWFLPKRLPGASA